MEKNILNIGIRNLAAKSHDFFASVNGALILILAVVELGLYDRREFQNVEQDKLMNDKMTDTNSSDYII